jgi:hypothetical protein
MQAGLRAACQALTLDVTANSEREVHGCDQGRLVVGHLVGACEAGQQAREEALGARHKVLAGVGELDLWSQDRGTAAAGCRTGVRALVLDPSAWSSNEPVVLDMSYWLHAAWCRLLSCCAKGRAAAVRRFRREAAGLPTGRLSVPAGAPKVIWLLT